MPCAGFFFCPDPFVKQLGGPVAAGFGVQGNTGQSRCVEAAAYFVIVNTHDADLVGDTVSRNLACLTQLAGKIVIACHNPDGFGQAVEPIHQKRSIVFQCVSRLARGRSVDMDFFAARVRDFLRKGV